MFSRARCVFLYTDFGKCPCGSERPPQIRSHSKLRRNTAATDPLCLTCAFLVCVTQLFHNAFNIMILQLHWGHSTLDLTFQKQNKVKFHFSLLAALTKLGMQVKNTGNKQITHLSFHGFSFLIQSDISPHLIVVHWTTRCMRDSVETLHSFRWTHKDNYHIILCVDVISLTAVIIKWLISLLLPCRHLLSPK